MLLHVFFNNTNKKQSVGAFAVFSVPVDAESSPVPADAEYNGSVPSIIRHSIMMEAALLLILINLWIWCLIKVLMENGDFLLHYKVYHLYAIKIGGITQTAQNSEIFFIFPL